MSPPRSPLVIFDFDGTIVVENSTRIFEKCIISRLNNRFLKHLLLALLFTKLSIIVDYLFRILGKLLDVSDSRRLVLVPMVSRLIKPDEVEECLAKASKSLNINEAVIKILKALNIEWDDVIVLSNGFKLIIELFAEAMGIHFKAIIATGLSRRGYYVTHEVRIPVKRLVLEKLSKKRRVIYVTDAFDEYLEFKRLEGVNSRLKTLLVATRKA